MSNLTRLPRRDFHPGTTSTALYGNIVTIAPEERNSPLRSVTDCGRSTDTVTRFFNLRDFLLSSLSTHTIAQHRTGVGGTTLQSVFSANVQAAWVPGFAVMQWVRSELTRIIHVDNSLILVFHVVYNMSSM